MTPFWSPGQGVEVQAKEEKPSSFRWGRRSHRVYEVSSHWRIHADWWSEEEVWRDYWEVTTDTSLLCVLYHDLLNGQWYLERIYE